MSDMWNPVLEALPRDELRDLQLNKFRNQLEYVYENSPFYRRKLDNSGIKPRNVQSFEDIRDIPTTTKDELREAQESDPFPYGDLLATDLEEVTEYHQTSGTTGEPVRQADSWTDWEWWSECWATVLWAQGIRPDDRVFFPFSYNIFIAFWAGHYACEKIGAEVVPGGNLSSEQRVRKMDELDVTVFMSTPTYALRLGEVAKEEGLDPSSMSIERIVCAGEPGASVPGTKNRIEELWGAKVYDHAGATEGGAWGFTCQGNSTGLHFNEAMFLIEVLDEEGNPVNPGERGELVITPLDRKAQPYIRFELRDQVELAGHEVCDCGRTYRFADGGILGRVDDLKKVNGVLVSPTAIEDVVRAFEHVSNEYKVIIDKHDTKDIDVIRLVAEASPDTSLSNSEITDSLQKRLKQTTNLTFDIQLVEYESIERPELKADRLTDRRPTHV
ncbi:MAG: AMP-binding protein [Halobacteria archaeon]|nr:AMP-binding protein [Halobacteria archaeon]